MDFLAGVRGLFANVNIFMADLISKLYLIILQIADAKIITDDIKEIIERIYAIIGLFMLFKLAFVIINYIINPEKTQAVGNLLKRIIISLVLIPTMPVIFERAYELQGIILTENTIGNIILGDGDLKQNAQDLEKVGDKVSFLIFSNFISYNTESPLSKVFDGCPNIFMVEDKSQKVTSDNYCCRIDIGCPIIPKCAYYLYYPESRDPEYFGVQDESGYYPYSHDNYYDCKSDKRLDITIAEGWTMACGIRDGKYIYDLINEARDNASVKTMLSSEIITAIENDPYFLDPPKTTCNSNTAVDSDGDFVFDYRFFEATLMGIFVIFMLIVLCVDVGIRTVKLGFLEVISPIPIVSYVDINNSKLFNSWLRETIMTYLQLFIRLAVIFFSILLFQWALDNAAKNDFIVNIFLIIGILLFTLQVPKLLTDLFNLNKENGFLSLIKDVTKFAVGAAAIGASAAGGVVSNAAHTKDRVKDSVSAAAINGKNFGENFKNANGILGKAGVVGSTLKSFGAVPMNFLKVPGGIIAGGVGAASKTAKSLIQNKGNYKSGTIISSVHSDVMAREAKYSGISKMNQNDIKLEISELENRQKNLQASYEQSREYLAFKLSQESNSSSIENAFMDGGYDNYADYVSNMTSSGHASDIISEDKYNEFDELYGKRENFEKELDEVEERLKLLNEYVKEK